MMHFLFHYNNLLKILYTYCWSNGKEGIESLKNYIDIKYKIWFINNCKIGVIVCLLFFYS